MADKEIKKEAINKEGPTKASVVTAPAHETTVVATPPVRERQLWVVWVVIVGFIVLMLLVIAAIVVSNCISENAVDQSDNSQIPYSSRHMQYGYGNDGSYYQTTTNTDGPTTTTTTMRYTQTIGVVTQVNANNIVVAGNGKSQTITTNSSTTYDNDTKPAVNDTVNVIGTADSNGNITATEVMVVNN